MMNALLLLLLCFSTAESFAPSQTIKIPCCTTSPPKHHHLACGGNSRLQPRSCSNSNTSLMTILPRRNFLQSSLLFGTVQIIRRPQEALAAEETTSITSISSPAPLSDETKPFHSAAYTLKEYTNSIVASRDTNISPKEVYDTISSNYLQEAYDAAIKSNTTPKALDVGAGAGVSTEVLYRLGYHEIDALDWSGEAWTRYVVEDPMGYCPEGVRFYELDDERYLDQWRGANSNTNGGGGGGGDKQQLFDIIVFNFAVNEAKAQQFAKELLNKQHGRLLAPINTSNDYWLKQTYQVMDSDGKVLWSAVDVGAWSVQFQPDVTQDTCSGIWCAPFNGFQKKR
eukprot:scaffold2180_cov98-Skeletonema_marinoi.AAC.8